MRTQNLKTEPFIQVSRHFMTWGLLDSLTANLIDQRPQNISVVESRSIGDWKLVQSDN